MPADLAAQIAATSASSPTATSQQTDKLYASQPRVHEPGEITVDEGHRVRPARAAADRHPYGDDAPLRTCRAGSSWCSMAADWSAAAAREHIDLRGLLREHRVRRRGRRLPAGAGFKWPEGARDVGAVVTWLRDHVRRVRRRSRTHLHRRDLQRLHCTPRRTSFGPELMPPGTARPAGAILLSGPYTFDFASPTKGELAYFGEDKSRWPQMVVPGATSPAPTSRCCSRPRSATTLDTRRRMRALFSELVDEAPPSPRFRQSLGHNHTSSCCRLGTADTSVVAEHPRLHRAHGQSLAVASTAGCTIRLVGPVAQLVRAGDSSIMVPSRRKARSGRDEFRETASG